MANVVDTKLYDILGVSPSASENELKKVRTLPIQTKSKCFDQNRVDKRELAIEMWPVNKLINVS